MQTLTNIIIITIILAIGGCSYLNVPGKVTYINILKDVDFDEVGYDPNSDMVYITRYKADLKPANTNIFKDLVLGIAGFAVGITF